MMKINTSCAADAASLFEKVCPDIHPGAASGLRDLANQLRCIPSEVDLGELTDLKTKPMAESLGTAALILQVSALSETELTSLWPELDCERLKQLCASQGTDVISRSLDKERLRELCRRVTVAADFLDLD